MSEFSLKRWTTTGLLAGGLIFSGCTGKQYAEKSDEVVEVPDAYSAVEVEQGPELQSWCSDFGSPELNGLVERAFDENLDLRQAWARLEQADAIRRQTNATLFPTVDAAGSAGAQLQNVQSLDTSVTPPAVVSEPDVVGNYRASIGAGYEIDLWGRLAAQRKAAAYDAQAVRSDVESMAISITSQVAEAWFDAVAQQEKVTLLEEQIEIAERYLELTRMRLSQGVATALDVNQQEQQIANLEGQLELVKARQAIAQNRIAVLLGKAPSNGAAVTTAELPELPTLPSSGVPTDLLERRPDVRSAYLRLESADERTAVAARSKLPTFRLSASLFLQATDLSSLLDTVFWSIAGTVNQTVFQGGRLNAEQERAEAAAKERLYAYASVIVRAISEVENAMVLEASQRRFLERLEAQRQNAEVALELARDRYRSGSLDYLRVLTALQSLQQIEQSLVDARRQQLSNRVQTCRALGGSWTQELSAPSDEFGEEQ